MFKLYKLIVSVSWMLSAAIFIFVGYYLYFEQKGSFTFNGEDIKLSFSVMFIFMSIACIFSAVGTYFQKRKTLFVVIPCLIFSIIYFIDNVMGEYVWAKYVYQSIAMVVINLATVHIILRQNVSLLKDA